MKKCYRIFLLATVVNPLIRIVVLKGPISQLQKYGKPQSRSTPTSGPPKVSARAPAHRSYHFRGVKLKSCIKKIHHNLYISKQANVRIKHADTKVPVIKNSAPMPEFSRTFMQTLRNKSNDTEKHEKVIKTQYHLNSLERTFLFANAVMTLS